MLGAGLDPVMRLERRNDVVEQFASRGSSTRRAERAPEPTRHIAARHRDDHRHCIAVRDEVVEDRGRRTLRGPVVHPPATAMTKDQ